ncbi:MAG: DUF4838 domain-containing protein [Thermoguttaceae bacterium]|nr:DUF4838 domain-containing protein [Thermoguttaceae bacterium]
MKAPRQIILTLLLAFSAAAAWSAETLTLTRDGKTDYVVVVPENAAPVQLSAANELAETLQEISGVPFPVKKESEIAAVSPEEKLLVIGPGAASKALLGPETDEDAVPYDGIILKQAGKSIVFSGHRQRGPLYAVYTFLEDELGCRWWTAAESTIPKRETVEADDFDVQYAPKLIYRESFYTGLMGNANAKIAAHLKTNGSSQMIPAELGGHHQYQYFVHSFYTVIKPEEFLDHPEWFSEIDGRRRIGGWWLSKENLSKIPAENIGEDGSQLCLTNEELFGVFLERVRKDLDANPEATIVSVSQNDCGGWCECEKCSKIAEEEGSQSGPMLRFVNRIAEELEKSHPNVLVDTLAYRYTRKPPKHAVARSNVIVRLCSIECSFIQNLDGEYGRSFETGERRPTDAPQNRPFRDDIEEWNRHAEHLFIWDYVTDFAQYLIPLPNYRILQDNVKFFVDHCTIGLFEQGDYQTTTGDFVQLRAWLLAKLLWNPDACQKALIEDFIAGYYAPDLVPIYLEYFDLLCDAAEKTGDEIGIYLPDTLSWLDLDTFNKCAGLLDRAEAVAGGLEKNDPARYENLLYKVRRERISLDMVLLQNYNTYAEEAQAEGKEFHAPPREEMAAFYSDFRARCKAAGLVCMKEGCSPEQFGEYMTEVIKEIVPEESAAEEANAQ